MASVKGAYARSRQPGWKEAIAVAGFTLAIWAMMSGVCGMQLLTCARHSHQHDEALA